MRMKFSLMMGRNDSRMKCTFSKNCLLRLHRAGLSAENTDSFEFIPFGDRVKDQILCWCTLLSLQQPSAFCHKVVICAICICAFF